MNPKSKGYGNLSRGSPKDLAKAHGSKMGRGCPRKGNRLRLPKERKGNGPRMPKRIRLAKEAKKQWRWSRKPKIV